MSGIPNESLRLEHLPRRSDDQLVWVKFALTFDGYAEKGGFEACNQFADQVRARWDAHGYLPTDLSDLRSALFFEQRRWRHSTEEPFAAEERGYWGALVEGIRKALAR